MLSQFFRRILGIGVRDEAKDCDTSISACESQSSLSSSETNIRSELPTISYDSIISVDLTNDNVNTSLHFSNQSICIVEEQRNYENCIDKDNFCATGDTYEPPGNDESDTQQMVDNLDGTNLSINVNYDYTELEARAGNEQCDFRDYDQGTNSDDDLIEESKYTCAAENDTNTERMTTDESPILSPGRCPLPTSSEDSIPDWDWGMFSYDRTEDILQSYYSEFGVNIKESSVWPSFDVTEYQDSNVEPTSLWNQDGKEMGQYADKSLPGGDSYGSTIQNARKSSSQENTSTPKIGNISFRSPRVSSKRRPDSPCPKMFNVPPSEAMGMVLTDAPHPEPYKEVSPEEACFSLHKHPVKAKKNMWAKVEPKLGIPSSLNQGLEETNSGMSVEAAVKPQRQPLRYTGATVFKFRPSIKTKDKYTYTLETFSTLSQCRTIKGRCDRFTQEYINCLPSDLVQTLRGWSRAVLVKPEKGVTIDPHFDLSCLNVEPGHVFLYDAPSAFERAAYRMDDHIDPEQSKKRNRSPKSERVKVERRGVPNKHLLKKLKEHEYMLESQEEDEDGAVGGEDHGWVEEEIETVNVEAELSTEVEDKTERAESPRVDFRHFEGVPVAVVQKKKTEDDIEEQYAVSNVTKKKNKNKKKQPKNQMKGNRECEEIKNILLGGDYGRGRVKGRPRYM